MISSTQMKTILDNVLGESKSSLVIGAENKESNIMYYYNFTDEDRVLDTVRLINDNFGVNMLKKFEQLNERCFKNKRKNSTVQSDFDGRCIRFGCFSDGVWECSVFNISHIAYHRTYGRKIVASLQLCNLPIFTLTNILNESFCGIFNREVGVCKDGQIKYYDGLKYDVNNMVHSNLKVRKIISEMFFVEAENTKKWILKDIGKVIDDQGWFLPDVDIEEIYKYRTPKELIIGHYPSSKKLSVNFNKVDLNKAHIMCTLCPIISKRSYRYLYTDITQDMLNLCFDLYNKYDGLLFQEIIAAYYVTLFNVTIKTMSVRLLANDYALMCINHNMPIKLGMTSKQLEKAHNEMAVFDRKIEYEKAFNSPLIQIPSKFDTLEEKLNENYSQEFERIKDAKRLYDEGESQRNCIFSRRQLIMEDEAAIFHWSYNGKEYTIQFSCYGGKFVIKEIKAKFNEECDIETKKILKSRLNLIQ